MLVDVFLNLFLPFWNCVPIEKVRKYKYDNESFCFSIYIDYEDTRRIGMKKKVLIVILTCILFIGIIIIVYYAVRGVFLANLFRFKRLAVRNKEICHAAGVFRVRWATT